MKNTLKILFCLLFFFGLPVSARVEEPKRLAVMISASWGSDQSMHNDLVAMNQVLRKRGWRADEILSLEGKLNRGLVLGFLNEIGKEVETWNEGEIFLYYTGHGSLKGDSVEEAVVGLLLSTEEQVSWSEAFTALRLPPKVRLILLPDS